MQYARSGSCSVAFGVGLLPSQYRTVLSQPAVTMQFISCTQKIDLIGASCCATCMHWFVARSHTLAILSPPPVKTRAPSPPHAAQSTGASCRCAAFGTACPFICTPQHRTCWSHEPATSRFEVGDHATQLIPSSAADGTSTSLFGLSDRAAGACAAAPNIGAPRSARARRASSARSSSGLAARTPLITRAAASPPSPRRGAPRRRARRPARLLPPPSSRPRAAAPSAPPRLSRRAGRRCHRARELRAR